MYTWKHVHTWEEATDDDDEHDDDNDNNIFFKYDIKTKAMIMMMMSLRGHYGLDV